MIVDALCNAFTPDRAAVWEAHLSTGLSVKVRDRGDDGFVEPAEMVDRMDELGIDTLLLPTALEGGAPHLVDFDSVAMSWSEMGSLAGRWPGRFAALVSPDPTAGMAGVRRARQQLSAEWAVGLYLHTHSWDRALDHADLYPYYALCADVDVPFAFQAGMSGGRAPSACGHPIGIDRPAMYFPEVRFLASHLGWPWIDEAIAMALKFPNVYLGTASYPPAHWPEAVLRFVRGPGRGKVLFSTSYPTVGHRRALAQRADLGLTAEIESDVFGGTARRVFTRLA